MDISKGEFLVVMGASEAGKSTLAACFNGLIPHYMRGAFKGDVVVLGVNTADASVPQLAEVVIISGILAFALGLLAYLGNRRIDQQIT